MHDFSFTDQSNGWTLPNDDLEPSLFFLWDSLHLTEEGKVKLAKLIISSVALRNNIYFLSNTGKRYSYSDTCKNKVSVSFPLTLNEAESPSLPPPIHAHKCKHSPYSNNCNIDLCGIHGSNYASSTKKPVSTKTVCIVGCNKPVIFSPAYTSLHAFNICISKNVRCGVSCKPVSALISSEPVKSFVTCKPVCFSNVSTTKEFNSVNYCLVA